MELCFELFGFFFLGFYCGSNGFVGNLDGEFFFVEFEVFFSYYNLFVFEYDNYFLGFFFGEIFEFF